MEAILQFGSRLLERSDRLMRRLLSAAKHEQLTGIVFWAALIGVCGAFAGVGFRASVRLVQQLLTGHSEPGWSRLRSCCPGGRASPCRPSAAPAPGCCCGSGNAVVRTRRARSTTWRRSRSVTASSAPRGAAAGRFLVLHHRFGRLDRTRGPAGAARGHRGLEDRPVDTGPGAAAAAAGGLRRGGRYRDRLQRADRRCAVRGRGGARLDRDGELRSADRLLGGGGCHQPPFPRLRPGLPGAASQFRCPLGAGAVCDCSACCSGMARRRSWRCWIGRGVAFRRLHWNPTGDPGARRADRRPDLGVRAAASGATATASSTTC